MARSAKTGTRFDKFTPNAIDIARESARPLGTLLNYQTSFCIKCQEDKPKKGFRNMRCAECATKSAKRGEQQ